MEINYISGGQPQGINEHSAERAERGERGERAERTDAGKFAGEQLKGQVTDMAKNENPPVFTVKLSTGEIIKGTAAPPVPSEIVPGDYIKLTAAEEGGKLVFRGIENADAKLGVEAKLAMMKSALDMAGLKADSGNIKLVSLLLENEMPINKDSVTALSRVVKFVGMENAEKALLLMKNDIQPTLGALEKLEEYAFGGGKLTEQIDALAKNIMEMDAGPVKQRLLQAFSDVLAESGVSKSAAAFAANEETIPAMQTRQVPQAAQTPQNAQVPQAAQTPQNAQILQATQSAQTPQTPQTPSDVQMPQALTPEDYGISNPAPHTHNTHAASSAMEGSLQSAPNLELDTGTFFLREVFAGKQDAELHLAQNPLPKHAEKFIDENLTKLGNGFSELVQKGEATKENVLNLIKTIVGTEGRMPVDIENSAEIKSFVLQLAEKYGTLDDNLEIAERYRGAISRGTRKIAERLAASIDGDEPAEELKKLFENMKEKLSNVAKELGDGAESAKIKQGIEEVKDNLKFLSELKTNQFLELPLIMDGRREHAELYVFPRKGGKNSRGHSQSALLSLDLANLGHFETYVQRNGRSVICQFRPGSDDAENITRENIDKLSVLLKDKNYSLDGFSFKKTEEKFTLLDEEPVPDGHGVSGKHIGSFSIDYRT